MSGLWSFLRGFAFLPTSAPPRYLLAALPEPVSLTKPLTKPPAAPVIPQQASAGAGAPSASPGAEGAARSTSQARLPHTVPPPGGTTDKARQAPFDHPAHRCSPQWPCDLCTALTGVIGEYKALRAEFDAECVARRHDGELFLARIRELEDRVRRLEDRKARRSR